MPPTYRKASLLLHGHVRGSGTRKGPHADKHLPDKDRHSHKEAVELAILIESQRQGRY